MSRYFSFLRKKRSPSLPDDAGEEIASITSAAKIKRQKGKKFPPSLLHVDDGFYDQRHSLQNFDFYDQAPDDVKGSSEVNSVHSDNDSLLDNLSYGEVCSSEGDKSLHWEKVDTLTDDSRPSSSNESHHTKDSNSDSATPDDRNGIRGRPSLDDDEGLSHDGITGDDEVADEESSATDVIEVEVTEHLIDDFMDEAFNDLESIEEDESDEGEVEVSESKTLGAEDMDLKTTPFAMENSEPLLPVDVGNSEPITPVCFGNSEAIAPVDGKFETLSQSNSEASLEANEPESNIEVEAILEQTWGANLVKGSSDEASVSRLLDPAETGVLCDLESIVTMPEEQLEPLKDETQAKVSLPIPEDERGSRNGEETSQNDPVVLEPNQLLDVIKLEVNTEEDKIDVEANCSSDITVLIDHCSDNIFIEGNNFEDNSDTIQENTDFHQLNHVENKEISINGEINLTDHCNLETTIDNGIILPSVRGEIKVVSDDNLGTCDVDGHMGNKNEMTATALEDEKEEDESYQSNDDVKLDVALFEAIDSNEVPVRELEDFETATPSVEDDKAIENLNTPLTKEEIDTAEDVVKTNVLCSSVESGEIITDKDTSTMLLSREKKETESDLKTSTISDENDKAVTGLKTNDKVMGDLDTSTGTLLVVKEETVGDSETGTGTLTTTSFMKNAVDNDADAVTRIIVEEIDLQTESILNETIMVKESDLPLENRPSAEPIETLELPNDSSLLENFTVDSVPDKKETELSEGKQSKTTEGLSIIDRITLSASTGTASEFEDEFDSAKEDLSDDDSGSESNVQNVFPDELPVSESVDRETCNLPIEKLVPHTPDVEEDAFKPVIPENGELIEPLSSDTAVDISCSLLDSSASTCQMDPTSSHNVKDLSDSTNSAVIPPQNVSAIVQEESSVGSSNSTGATENVIVPPNSIDHSQNSSSVDSICKCPEVSAPSAADKVPNNDAKACTGTATDLSVSNLTNSSQICLSENVAKEVADSESDCSDESDCTISKGNEDLPDEESVFPADEFGVTDDEPKSPMRIVGEDAADDRNVKRDDELISSSLSSSNNSASASASSSSKKLPSVSSEDQLFEHSDHVEAEARLAQRRAARAEARELRLRELEKQQLDQDDEDEQQYAANATSPPADKKLQTAAPSPPRTNAPFISKASPRGTPSARASAGRSSLANSTGSGGQFSRRSSEDSTPDDALPLSTREIKAELKELEEKFRKAMITNAQLDNEKATLTYEVEFLKDKYSDLDESHNQLTKEHRKKCSENETLRKVTNKLKEEVKMIRKVLQERDSLIQEYGLVLIGEENGEENFDEHDEEMDDETINDLSPRKIGVKKALLSTEASELLSKGAAQGSLDVRLRKYAECKNDLEDEVRRLKLELEEELSKRRKENGLDYEKQKEASKSINEYKFRVQKAEAEVSTLQANVARLESLVSRYKASTEELEKSEEDLKSEKRKLQRELREAQNRLEELELTTSHLQKRFDKLKTARSTLLKDLSLDPV